MVVGTLHDNQVWKSHNTKRCLVVVHLNIIMTHSGVLGDYNIVLHMNLSWVRYGHKCSWDSLIPNTRQIAEVPNCSFHTWTRAAATVVVSESDVLCSWVMKYADWGSFRGQGNSHVPISCGIYFRKFNIPWLEFRFRIRHPLTTHNRRRSHLPPSD